MHAGGDRSGAEVQRTLDQSAIAAGVEVLDHAFALDLVDGHHRTACARRPASASPITDADGDVESVGVVTARAVVHRHRRLRPDLRLHVEPAGRHRRRLALALRAGLPARDIEFVQFHPTVMWRGPDATGQQALISEAVRGEGAILYDAAGERVMARCSPARGPRAP